VTEHVEFKLQLVVEITATSINHKHDSARCYVIRLPSHAIVQSARRSVLSTRTQSKHSTQGLTLLRLDHVTLLTKCP